jgi:hypothetical protein
VAVPRLDLKVAIIRSGRTQRGLAAETAIPEIRLSNIVRGITVPNSTERTALYAVLGEDYFNGLELAGIEGTSARA